MKLFCFFGSDDTIIHETVCGVNGRYGVIFSDMENKTDNDNAWEKKKPPQS